MKNKILNNFKYSNTNKRYHTWDYHLKSKYGEKVAKVTLNGRFGCPNRDGTVAYGSCYFCSAKGSGDFAGDIRKQLKDQYVEQKEKVLKKWPKVKKFMVYFQANTNTHDTVENLRKRFDQFKDYKEVVGICIGTRPDCLPEDVIEYLSELNQHFDVWIEVGLQTVHDKTADEFNRAYKTELFFQKIKELRKHNINVATHIINSLPGETKEMMMETIRQVCSQDIQSVKIHMLHIVKSSPWGLAYKAIKWKDNLLNKEEYVDLVLKQLRIIRPEIIIQRLTGEAGEDELIIPEWTMKKRDVLNLIDKQMAANDWYQGDMLKKEDK